MISYIVTGAAAMLIGMASGQTLVLSLGRRRLSSQLAAAVERQVEMHNRLDVLESAQAGIDEAGESVSARLQRLEDGLPGLITRAEVERAFAQVAQMEAQKQAAASQQARAQAVFGNGSAPSDMNTAINAQLSSLSERINRINQEFGVRA
jgi:multidrug resistance efflux pump